MWFMLFPWACTSPAQVLVPAGAAVRAGTARARPLATRSKANASKANDQAGDPRAVPAPHPQPPARAFTITLNAQVAAFPATSRAVTSTVVSPTGKLAPEGVLYERAGAGSWSSVAVAAA